MTDYKSNYTGAEVDASIKYTQDFNNLQILQAGDNISIDKASDSEKIVIKAEGLVKSFRSASSATYNAYVADTSTGLDITIPVIAGSAEADSIARRTSSGRLKANNPIDPYDCVNKQYLEANALLTNNVKTLFGNQSITGSGNIDLYTHNILCGDAGSDILLFSFVSTSNLQCASWEDVSSILPEGGQEIIMQCSGALSNVAITCLDVSDTSGGYIFYTADGQPHSVSDISFTRDSCVAIHK